MEQLLEKIMSMQSRSDSVNTSLFDKREHIEKLHRTCNLLRKVQVPPMGLFPNCLVQQQVLYPFWKQVGGTILSAKLAKERGWAINVGGGFHHYSAEKGDGFCAYADISLCIHFALVRLNISRVMIIDLDAHQGNGHETDFAYDSMATKITPYVKWSKGKQKEKVNNQVLFDQGTYDKLLSEAPKFKLITPSILSDRLRVHGELDTRVGQASSLSAQIRHFYASLSATLGVGLRYDKHDKLRYTEGLVEIREDYIEDSHKGETKSEFEGILMSHPSIEDAAVVPQKDDVAGEVPVAFVVRSSNDPI
ncbi:hypothetical protein AHAS_Ahas19G0275600 [Arachis hypogaea]